MTPRIAIALALALALVWNTASAAETATERVADPLQTLPNLRSPGVTSTESALQTGTAGALPVIEIVAPPPLTETIDLTVEPEELYQRIRQGFSMPNINTSSVLHHQQWYLNHPDSLRRMVERSSRYLHHIVEEIEKRGMPTELALLPMVESAYNPTAYSRSRASGLWQFIPATGKQYKLEQNWWLDARRDIIASTAAALDYLQYIYELHGDWHLALASYNWGEGAVGRAINKNRAQGLPTDYLSLSMPDETRQYVPKLQALKNIFSNPRVLANLNIRGVPNRPYFATVTKTANIDVKLAARLAEMPVQEFVALNPAHNRPVIKSETPMVIPADKVDRFINNLEAHEESEQPLASWQAYTLRPGETLEQVAARFGMTVATLKAVNGINGKARVAAGQPLLVARQEGAEVADLAGLPEPPALAAASSEPPPRPLVQPRQPEPINVQTPPVTPRVHVVRKGETLFKVAQQYGMTIAELKQNNKLRADKVTPGTRLAVAGPVPSSKLASREPQRVAAGELENRAPVARSTTAAAAETRRTHTVSKGETLLKVAQRYGISLSELKQINKIRHDHVVSGTKLAIVTPSGSGSAHPSADLAESDNRRARTAVSRLTLAKADNRKADSKTDAKTNRRFADTPAASAHAAAKKPARLAQYTIRRGDTLASIARQFRVDADDLLRWNRLPARSIKAGQTLTIQLVQNTL
ncbi:MAG TPA: LysM peptidoglycan-binding domain-containing protein [Accumulibacter sp.]|uniref:LysM peptidoglycan-binding domain-containing protein n=1 Tax=Accumulibacter sp. TaxID=2053492 RepID=UPI00287919EB|nr:LysM peptidoglycan-binding domain-containing protein [Accumulibacter sp.]MDS4053727.1 LysM peptidoglycan-binding domain-containing protein [Accumulibacter sp.]HMV04758.1 LysM peptidoglycan-binding domain-containing protein [Accumulibacter sp.]HMW63016.1 LysM peptidoglycan-binding domain-containing protein [Accumulibacter sp.]HNH91762.1 LysM peptidoglycan-binding domain-containing protein [Accumulibacter sp.]HNK02910.1 LysM peptidoglycan-binding domain-containing protein [Accumulibacter sp.]